MRKAQSAFEFLGVALIGVLLFVPLFFIAMDFVGTRSFESALGQTRTTTTSLADAANGMCLQPQDSKTEIVATLPSFLNEVNISGKTISFTLKRGDRTEHVTATTKCDIQDSPALSTEAGTFLIEVRRDAGVVNIAKKS